uniref:Ig-like domain-containing protein n=1 Tax=Myotis lucifugus TaxID=59463 RepID=G1QCL2_MYOLU
THPEPPTLTPEPLTLTLSLPHSALGDLPKPSLRAEPGPVIPRGRPVTFVCQGPAGAKFFRLEKDAGYYYYKDEQSVSPHGSQGTEARIHFSPVSEDTAGNYFCRYFKRYDWENSPIWSERSERLQLQVTEDPTPPSGWWCPALSPGRALWGPGEQASCGHFGSIFPALPGLSSKYVYILVGTSVAVLLCLLLLVLLLVRRRRQRKHESLHSKGGEQRPQERLNPAADITEGTPDEATVCAPPEKNRETPSPSPDAGDAQEVTYASWTQTQPTVGGLFPETQLQSYSHPAHSSH